MKTIPHRIIPLSRTHLDACRTIVADSEPWKTLGSGIDFAPALTKSRSYLRAYVCIRNARVAGFVLFSPHPVFAQGGYIRAIGVAPDMRRSGIGKTMLTFAETMIARGAPNVYLCVSSFNRGGQAFYRGLGYARVGKLHALLKDGMTEYIYWKRLKPGITMKDRKGMRLS